MIQLLQSPSIGTSSNYQIAKIAIKDIYRRCFFLFLQRILLFPVLFVLLPADVAVPWQFPCF